MISPKKRMNNDKSKEKGGSSSSCSNPEVEKYGTEVMGAPAVPTSHPNNQKAATWSAGDHPPEYHHQPYVQYSPVPKPAANPMDTVVHKFNIWSAKAEKTANNIWHNCMPLSPTLSFLFFKFISMFIYFYFIFFNWTCSYTGALLFP